MRLAGYSVLADEVRPDGYERVLLRSAGRAALALRKGPYVVVIEVNRETQAGPDEAEDSARFPKLLDDCARVILSRVS
jgi:hypothetical protein